VIAKSIRWHCTTERRQVMRFSGIAEEMFDDETRPFETAVQQCEHAHSTATFLDDLRLIGLEGWSEQAESTKDSHFTV
jgi:hypothetical protein